MNNNIALLDILRDINLDKISKKEITFFHKKKNFNYRGIWFNWYKPFIFFT